MLLRYALVLACLAAPAVAAQPDLTISATAEDASGDAGGRVTLDYTVSLTGAEEIEDISVGFYFSTDQTLSSDDALSEREEVDAESDESESDNEQIDIPNSLSAGEYFILVVIDDQEQLTESNEDNNTVAIPFSVGGGGTGGGGDADLTVTSVSSESASGAAGDEIEGEYALANLGSEQAGESQVGFYLSTNATLSSNDTFLTREDADEVDANGDGDGDFEFTVPASLAPGDYFLIAVADDRNAVTESDESNNTASTPFTITGNGGGGSGGGNADLIVTSVSAEPTSGAAGDEIEGEYAIANTGTEQAGASQTGIYLSTDNNLSSNDILLTREDNDEVDADGDGDGDFEFTVPSSVEPGDYFILVVADDRNVVDESSENNNVESTPFTVTGDGGGGSGGGDADLRIAVASVTPTSADPGDSIEIAYTLSNTGTADAGETQVGVYISTDDQLSSNDVLVTRLDADGVEAGDTEDSDEDVTVPNNLSAGDYFVLFVADDRNTVSESRESNNTRAVAFTVTGTGGSGDGEADLRITEVEAEPESAAAGETVDVSYTLQNNGDGDAGASEVAVYFSTDNSLSNSDTRLNAMTAQPLDADNDEDGEISVTVPDVAPGEYFLIVVADDGNNVAENRESNNTRALAFTVAMGNATDGDADAALTLSAPAPNPVTASAVVRFALATAGDARLVVTDVLGREVAVLAAGPHAAGAHEVTWNADALASGLYVLRIETNGTAETRTATVVR